MSMNGIDVSSWQNGIDFGVVPCEFVIIKATGGTGYTNPDYARAVENALANHKTRGRSGMPVPRSRRRTIAYRGRNSIWDARCLPWIGSRNWDWACHGRRRGLTGFT